MDQEKNGKEEKHFQHFFPGNTYIYKYEFNLHFIMFGEEGPLIWTMFLPERTKFLVDILYVTHQTFNSSITYS